MCKLFLHTIDSKPIQAVSVTAQEFLRSCIGTPKPHICTLQGALGYKKPRKNGKQPMSEKVGPFLSSLLQCRNIRLPEIEVLVCNRTYMSPMLCQENVAEDDEEEEDYDPPERASESLGQDD